jgi:putative proteasome-type protease
MTYCGGILVREGLVMFADTRTNAGVDNISTFRKLHIFKDPKKRVMAIASAGNLSISQSVVSILTEGYDNPDTGERETLMNAPTLFQAAQRVGRVVRTIRATEGKVLEASDVTFDVSFLFGGQIIGERMRLFMIYSAGNFIECTVDTPYLQIGEHKYGKPVLDRAINYEMDIYDALKVGLVSVDSTMRSNLSVGMPIDLMVLRRDTPTGADAGHVPDNSEPMKQGLPQRMAFATIRSEQKGGRDGCEEGCVGNGRRHGSRSSGNVGVDAGRLCRRARRPPQGSSRSSRRGRRADAG